MPSKTTSKTVARQRAIQRRVDAKLAKKSAHKADAAKTPVQAGHRREPVPPMPAQHQAKPGLEQELRPAPRYLAPDYAGSGKLEGMAAIVTGGDSGIGRAVAVLFAR